jgi:hypothetical protein
VSGTQSRGFPTRIDYSRAIRTPETCFVDSQLQRGNVAINSKNNLPIARSGKFGLVFRVTASSTPFAIKCFVLNQNGRERRSRTLSQTLASDVRDWYVPFDFQDHGIRVGDTDWPIAKMQWVDGVSLTSFIETHLDDAQELLELAGRFRTVVEDLAARGWAHGDLQHGNILVLPGGQLRLVDYDGMYVPSLAGVPSGEAGHPNYQHPGRSSDGLELYGAAMDRYSAWVIYGSILLCAHQPESWEECEGGVNKILLDANDLADPTTSRALRRWHESDREPVRQVAAALTGILTRPPSDTPSLRRLNAETNVPSRRKAHAAGTAPAAEGRACSRCRAPAGEDDRYCERCGQSLRQPGAVACPRCDAHVEQGQRFCEECGFSLRRPSAPICPQCGSPGEGDYRYCEQCGSPMARAASSSVN